MNQHKILKQIYETDDWFSPKFINETRMFLSMIIKGEEKRFGKTLKEWKEHFENIKKGESSWFDEIRIFLGGKE